MVFGIVLIVVGVTLVSTAFALFTNILVSRRIEQSLGRRRVPGHAGHVVVVGLGAVGVRVVEGLVAEGRRVVVVERDDATATSTGPGPCGCRWSSPTPPSARPTTSVNLAEASAVAVLTSADLTNIETGLAVRESLGTGGTRCPVVLRVFDRELARMMERNFGFRHVRSTSALAAPWFVGAALGLDVLETFFVDQQPFLVGRLDHRPGGGLAGAGHAGPVGPDPGGGHQPGRAAGLLEHPPRRGPGSPGATRPTCSAPTRSCSACSAGTS